MELDRLKVSRVLARLYELSLEKGVRLEMHRDFEQLEAMLNVSAEKKLTEHFRRSLNTHSPPQAFWLGGFNNAGEIVGLAAARLDQLGSWSLSRYWQEYWPRCYPSEDKKPVSLADKQYEFSNKVTGDTAYLGEMWINPSHPEKDVARSFSRALLLLSLLEWNCEWYYAWVRPAFLERGFAVKCGFARVHPGIRWQRGPSTIDQDLKVMLNHRSDSVDLVDLLSFELLGE